MGSGSGRRGPVVRKREAESEFGIHETPTRPAFVPEAAQSAIVKKAQAEPPPSDAAAIAAVFEESVRELLARAAPPGPPPPAAPLDFVVVEASLPAPEPEPEAETTPMPRTPPPRRKRWKLRIALLAVLVAGEVALAYRASVAHGVHTVAALVGAR